MAFNTFYCPVSSELETLIYTCKIPLLIFLAKQQWSKTIKIHLNLLQSLNFISSPRFNDFQMLRRG